MAPSDQHGTGPDYERFGLLFSVTAHVLVFTFGLLSNVFEGEPPPTPIYSVTFEGGKTLGGRSQVSKDDKKSPIAPPKNVSSPQKKEEPKKEEKTEEKPVEPPKPEVKEPPKEEKNTVPIHEVKKEEPKKEKVEEKPEPKKEEKKKVEPPKSKEEPRPPKKDPPPDLNKEYQKAMQRYLGDSSNAGGEGFGAAKLGGEGTGGGQVVPREVMLYMQLLEERVKAGWRWFDTQSVLVASVRMYISREGTISSEKIMKSSGNRAYDESILRAVHDANPLPPPPKNFYEGYFQYADVVFDNSKR